MRLEDAEIASALVEGPPDLLSQGAGALNRGAYQTPRLGRFNAAAS